MKHLLFTIFFLCSTIYIFGQSSKKIDSANYYQKELTSIYKKNRDSLFTNPQVVELRKNIERIQSKGDNYRGFILYSSFASANFDKFNNANTKNGFKGLSNNTFSIGYGFTSKKNRRIFDFNVSAFGMGKTSKKNDEIIKTAFSNFLQFEWGYDFIKSNKVNIYPFAGLGIRSSTLSFESNGSANPNFTGVSNIIQNNKSFNEEATEIGYQAGLGIEYVISNKERAGGTLLFLKAGTNRPFKQKNFKIAGVEYDPQFNHGELLFSFGFKFFSR